MINPIIFWSLVGAAVAVVIFIFIPPLIESLHLVGFP